MVINENDDNGTVQGAGSISGNGRTTGGNAEDRMKAFFANPLNAVLYPVGQLLTLMLPMIAPADLLAKVYGFYRDRLRDDLCPLDMDRIDPNLRLNYAQVVAAGESIERTWIPYNGVRLPLKPGFSLSLKTLRDWECPACHSAHGSGVGPSDKGRGPSVRGLMSNQWFYRPADCALFVISKSCFDNYVKAVGQKTPARFDSVVPAGRYLPVVAVAGSAGLVLHTAEEKAAEILHTALAAQETASSATAEDIADVLALAAAAAAVTAAEAAAAEAAAAEAEVERMSRRMSLDAPREDKRNKRK